MSKLTRQTGQAALEYLILLTVAAVVVFIAVKPSATNSLLNRSQTSTEGYYNIVTEVIMGKNPDPIDGGWCRPAKPNGECECACPAPAFGGRYCVTDGECRSAAPGSIQYCGDGICTHGLETGQPGNPGGLLTCFEDCAYQNDCSACGDLIPSATCGIPCPITRCNPSQVCMTSDCGPSCPGFRQECRENPLLCTSTCRCPSTSLQPVGAACGGTCGPYTLGPNERCFRYNVAQCTGTCSQYELYVGRVSGGCNNCVNGVKDGTEVAIDCGGNCQSCCGNSTIDPGEQCDTGNRFNDPTCSSDCQLYANCIPSMAFPCPRVAGSNYCCGQTTFGNNGGNFCRIPQRCDPGETEANCAEDCSTCIPNGNCVSTDGTYTCGGTTTGVSENCPTVACTIPQRCDPTENCQTCPEDCPRGACVADATYVCGGPTPEGHYINCPSVDCSLPQMCDAPAENCTTCPGDCGTCLCTGTTPPGSIPCPNAETNVTVATPKVLVGSCGSAKCEFTCGPGYAYINGACVCQTGTCDGACLPMIINSGAACGNQPMTLPGVRHGDVSRVACPGGPCIGEKWTLCFNSQFIGGIHGACGPEACPATSAPHAFCGTATWPASPVGDIALGTCGELCAPTGITQRNCWAGGVWSGGYAYSTTGPTACVLLPRPSCTAQSYTSPCGIVDIPNLVSGQTYTTSCPTGGSGCYGGTISAACVDGTVSIHNNCHTCGDHIIQTGEVCDGGTVACTTPETGYKTCRSDCKGYEACIPFGCEEMTFNVSTCGSVTLPESDDGDALSLSCPTGCSGAVTARCSGKDFINVTSTCTPDPCPDTIVDTECGRVTLVRKNSGETSSADCPSGCPGGVSALCGNGNFGTLSGACSIDACPATPMATPCGAVTMPAIGGRQTQSVQCPTGCTGTLLATCNNGAFTGNSNSCVPAPCTATTLFTACGDTTLPATPHGSSIGPACPGGCGGTINATCDSGRFCIGGVCAASGGFINNDTVCTHDCEGFDYGFDAPNTCPLITIPTTPNNGSRIVACGTGCAGSITASCSGGEFTMSGTCTEAPCPGETVTPPAPGDVCPLWFAGDPNNTSRTVQCSTVGCTGSVTGTCLRGRYRDFTGGCVPCNPNGTCAGPETITNCPADCGCNANGTCQSARQETAGNCPADCGCNNNNICESARQETNACTGDCGCNNNGTCQAQRGETTANCVADCPPPAVCPNGICEPGETAATCVADCHCGNGFCEGTYSESDGNCPADCGCPNGRCDWYEDLLSCAADCPAGCNNNGYCNTQSENQTSCPSDCYSCNNDGRCEAGSGETAGTCAADCACTAGSTTNSGGKEVWAAGSESVCRPGPTAANNPPFGQLSDYYCASAGGVNLDCGGTCGSVTCSANTFCNVSTDRNVWCNDNGGMVCQSDPSRCNCGDGLCTLNEQANCAGDCAGDAYGPFNTGSPADTCDGNTSASFTCPAGVSRVCVDNNGLNQWRNVTCRP